MKNKSVLLIAILSIIILFQNCSNDEIILNEDYIWVTDIYRYVNQKEICKDTTKWLNKEIKVKGYINREDFQLNKDHFSLFDIRNGSSIHVYAHIDTSLINKVNSSDVSSVCYIRGVLKEDPNIIIGIVSDFKTPDCNKIPAIYLYNIEDIYFK
ncbi:MAG TPA: hypothetical protein PK081_03255 [Bacteroidales bacterium]|jgi:hypothetical protein|nr:hypothetical protein [Bacteroidales bacterium]